MRMSLTVRLEVRESSGHLTDMRTKSGTGTPWTVRGSVEGPG